VLSRRQLAEEMGMSVVPVAEALQRLETEELVESQPRVGTRLRIATPQDVRGHYVVREALETQSARLFAEKAAMERRKRSLPWLPGLTRPMRLPPPGS
jgi:DNA-binding GntR family transcriptional regulator